MSINLTVNKSNNFISSRGWGITLFLDNEDSKCSLLICGKKEIFNIEKLKNEESNLNEQLSELPTKNNEIEKVLKRFISKTYDRLSIRDETVSLSVMLFVNETVYLSSVGEVGVYFFREGQYAKLVSRSWPPVFLKGEIKNEDIVFVSTEEFFNVLTPGRINRMILTEKNDIKISRFITSELLQRSLQIPHILIETEETYVQKRAGNVPLNYNVNGDISVNRDLSNQQTSLIETLKSRFLTKSIDAELYSKRNKKAAFVGVILLTILIVSITFGVKKRRMQDIKDSYSNDLTTAQHRLNESLDIFSLNKTRSRELFLESKNLMQNLTEKGITDSELVDLKNNIEQNQGKILGEFIVEPQTFLDLELVTDNFNSDKMMFSNGYVYVVDKRSRKIIKLSVASKRSEVLVGPNKIDEIYDAAAYVDRIFVFNKDGIFDLTNTKKKLVDSTEGDNILTTAFAGNLYLLNKSSSRILRYPGDGEVFGEGKDWLSASTAINLGTAKSMQIDGSIWVLVEGNVIHKFTQGNLQNYSLDDGYAEGVHIDNFFVSDETDDLYVLDSEKGGIYVFDKSGIYVARYESGEVKDATSLVVSEVDKRMVVLKGNKLLSMELKHLD